jgi:hypothetical protein
MRRALEDLALRHPWLYAASMGIAVGVIWMMWFSLPIGALLGLLVFGVVG